MSGFLSLPGSRRSYSALGIPVHVLATGTDTAGEFDAIAVDFPPGIPFPAHRHHNSDEAFYVISGEMTATIGAITKVVGPGTFGHAPKGVVHGFSNQGAEPARIVAWQWPPPDVKGFLEELAKLPAGEEPDMERLMSIMARFDIEPAE